jgi:hypothetical protein
LVCQLGGITGGNVYGRQGIGSHFRGTDPKGCTSFGVGITGGIGGTYGVIGGRYGGIDGRYSGIGARYGDMG